MKILNYLGTEEIENHFEEFSLLIDPTTWTNLVRNLEDDIRGNPHLKEYIHHRYNLAFILNELTGLKNSGQPLPLSIDSRELYEAYSFITQSVSLAEQFDKKHKNAFVGRVKGAFSNHIDLNALKFELLVAINLTRNGWALDFPEQINAGTFDWLCTLNDFEMEVECKWISGEKGRHVNKRHVREMQELFRNNLASYIGEFKGGLIIRINLKNEKLTTAESQFSLVQLVKDAILTNKSITQEWVSIELAEFEFNTSPFNAPNPDEQKIRAFIDSHPHLVNRETSISYTPQKRSIIFSLGGDHDEKLLEETFKTIKQAAKRQLTKTRPGAILVKFEDVSNEQMEELGREIGQATSLRVYASNLLNSTNYQHIVCLSFYANGECVKTDNGEVTESGSVYQFTNKETRWGDDPRMGLFMQRYET